MNLEEQIMQGLDNELIQEYLSCFEEVPMDALSLLTEPKILSMIGQLTDDRKEQLDLLSDVHDLYLVFVPDFRDYETAEQQQEFQVMYYGVVKSTIGLMDRYRNDLSSFHQSVADIYDGVPLEPEMEDSKQIK